MFIHLSDGQGQSPGRLCICGKRLKSKTGRPKSEIIWLAILVCSPPWPLAFAHLAPTSFSKQGSLAHWCTLVKIFTFSSAGFETSLVGLTPVLDPGLVTGSYKRPSLPKRQSASVLFHAQVQPKKSDRLSKPVAKLWLGCREQSDEGIQAPSYEIA